MNLKELEIKDAFDVVSGSTPSSAVEEYWSNGKIKWITPTDLSKLKSPYIETTERKITEKGLKNCSANLIPRNSIIVSSRAPIGYVAVLKDEMTCNQGCKALVPKNGNIDSLFAYYLVNTKVEEMKRLGSGSTFKEISKSKIETIKILLPDLKTQKKIASILEQADSARQKRKQANQLTEQFLQSTFLEMFGDPLTNPKKYKIVTIGDLCEIRRGASPRPIDKFTGGNIPWIKISDATAEASSLYIFKTKVHVTKEGAEKSVFVPEGSLIFANCGVSLGFARIMKTGGCIHDGWLSLFNFSKEIDVLFLLSWINQMTYYLRKLAPDGTQPNLNISIMKNLKFPLPPYPLQKKYATLVGHVEQLRIKQRESEKELENLFNSLMQKYFE